MSIMCKRLFLVFVGCLLIMSLLSYGILAADGDPIEKYPHDQVRIIVAYGVGGSTDLINRVIAKGMSEYLGTNVYVENKTGGAGTVGNVALLNSKPDGRTICTIAGGAGIISPVKEMPQEVDRDLVHIAHINDFAAAIWVKSDSQFKTFDDIVKYAQQNPGKLVYAAEEAIGVNAMAFDVLSQIAGPFEYSILTTDSSADSTRLLVAGEVDVVNTSLAGVIRFYEEGLIRPILVNRLIPIPGIPEDVPLANDIYPEYTPIVSSGGLAAPVGFPEEERQMLENAIKWTIESPKYQEEFDKLGATMNFMIGEESGKHFIFLYKTSLEFVKRKGIK